MAKIKRIKCELCHTPMNVDEYCVYCGINPEGEVDESVKFAWAYMLLHGKVTDGKWSYYGGGWDSPTGMGWEEQYKAMENLRADVVEIGIDWKKTGVPYVSDESTFNGTFDSAGSTQATLGKLVLNNGKTYKIGSSDEDAAHLVETARAMMNKKTSPVQELANKL